jgi:hypothetical protein
MRLQNVGHFAFAMLMTCTAVTADDAPSQKPLHDYPTTARVEYVTACMDKVTSKLAALYQCSCAIDRIADALSYDDYVESSTFARYASLPGEGGGIFRDSKRGRELGKKYLQLEKDSLQACGMR